MSSRKRYNDKHEEEPGADRYLITYADLITLLLGLFVILYASSQVDSSKFKEFSQAFSTYFNEKGVTEGGNGVLEGRKDGVPEAILPGMGNKSLDEIAEKTGEALAAYVKNGTIQIRVTQSGIVLVLPEKLLFKSGKSELQPGSFGVLDTLAALLSDVKYQISIDGHTDSDPIKSFQFESNWHLSVSRAMNVAYRLIGLGLPERNVTVRGFGAQRPEADNSTAEGKAKNRRVEIIISDAGSDSPAIVDTLSK